MAVAASGPVNLLSRKLPRGLAMFGGALVGVMGALLAIPTAAAIQIALREWMEYRREVAPLTRGG